jgi:GNAT superfamily N-acetyltransferase
MIPIERLEQAEHDAWEDQYRACPAAVAAGLGLGVERIGRALYLQARAIPLTQFNRVCGLGFEGADEAIRAGLQRFRAAGIAQAWFQVAPGPHRPDLELFLQKSGLQLHQRRWVKFWRPPEPAPHVNTELTIVAVDHNSAGVFADTVLAGFGMPPMLKSWLETLPGRDGWHCFLALSGDEPAGGGAMRIANGIAWLGIGAVRPEHRRKGAQSALLAARIAAGLELGVDGFTTETGRPLPGEAGPSFANIQRAGFQIAYDRPNWGFG